MHKFQHWPTENVQFQKVNYIGQNRKFAAIFQALYAIIVRLICFHLAKKMGEREIIHSYTVIQLYFG